MSKPINIVDLFAGPGGLGEGFSSCKIKGKAAFKIRVSVEKEPSAHQTLTLRAFYRLLSTKNHREIYHKYVTGSIPKEEMIEALPYEWSEALRETLEQPSALGDDNARIHERLKHLKAEHSDESWVVIGGPPCQAYSLAGRSRNKGIKGYKAEDDRRHFLYQEYLEVLNIIQPDVFVMENVKGILTSKVNDKHIFPKIRQDLQYPAGAVESKATRAGKRYRLYSFAAPPEGSDSPNPHYASDSSFIIRAERFGVPQARHRVILLGVSTDLNRAPGLLQEQPVVNIENVLRGLPPLRSKLSRGLDSPEAWSAAIFEQARNVFAEAPARSALKKLSKRMVKTASSLGSNAPVIARSYKCYPPISSKLSADLRKWLLSDMPEFVLNHESRGHIPADLARYLFCGCWAQENRDADTVTPKAMDFPACLQPKHANWTSGHFADRFRVQAKGRPATTITSHISKDGHYYIHYDPRQCRSLTVREAARIQTFPDNYFFEGNRTQQYVQVGNAVPPFLARKMAEIVYGLLK